MKSRLDIFPGARVRLVNLGEKNAYFNGLEGMVISTGETQPPPFVKPFPKEKIEKDADGKVVEPTHVVDVNGKKWKTRKLLADRLKEIEEEIK